MDEFDPSKPFYQQVLLIDTTIKDIQSVRIRHNDVVGKEEDVFRGFRTIPFAGEANPHIYPNGEVYNQVPSYYATVSNTASMYSTSNKSDIPGEAHPGLSSDTRFGVLIPNQKPNSGRGGHANQRNDRYSDRGNYQHDRGAYAQHLNRRGRRDMQFGRGQGRTDERGQGRFDERIQARGSRGYGHREMRGDHHYDGGEYHRNDVRETRNRYHPAREYGNSQDQHWPGYVAEPVYNKSPYPQEALPVYRPFEDNGAGASAPSEGMLNYGQAFQPTPDFMAHAGASMPSIMSHGISHPTMFWPQAMAYGAYPLAPMLNYDTNAQFPMDTLQSATESDLLDDTPRFVLAPPPPALRTQRNNHSRGNHSPLIIGNLDDEVVVSMGSGQSREIRNTRPQLVVSHSTPANVHDVGNFSQGTEGLLRATAHPPTALGKTPGRSPMRTTTDEGSPLMRLRRAVTDSASQHTPLTQAAPNPSSRSNLHGLATHTGFAIVEPRSSPSAGTFSPRPGSPANGNVNSTTARSSPGMPFSSMGPTSSRQLARNSSSHELTYVGYTICGQTDGAISREPTPPANVARRWFQSRQYVPESRVSSPGAASSAYNGEFHTDHRSEDGRI